MLRRREKKGEGKKKERKETHAETPTSVAAISGERVTVLFRAPFLPRP